MRETSEPSFIQLTRRKLSLRSAGAAIDRLRYSKEPSRPSVLISQCPGKAAMGSCGPLSIHYAGLFAMRSGRSCPECCRSRARCADSDTPTDRLVRNPFSADGITKLRCVTQSADDSLPEGRVSIPVKETESRQTSFAEIWSLLILLQKDLNPKDATIVDLCQQYEDIYRKSKC
jgi:hypothetical protein